MDGYAYDVHPYVLMNYNDDYESVTTVAHEWGHAMHSYLRQQGAAVRHVELRDLRRPRSRRRSTRSCCSQLRAEDARRPTTSGSTTSAMRSSSCAARSSARRCSPSSSATCTARVDKGEPLTGEALTKIYCEILQALPRRRSEGVVKIDDAVRDRVGVHPALLQSLLRLPVRDLDRGELALRRSAIRGASRARSTLPGAAARRAARTIPTSS